MIRVPILFSFVALISCSGKKDGVNKFSDATFISIADFQDRRLSDSLYRFFTHENLAYRRDAVLAFASIQDTSAVDKIAALLNDPGTEVRNAAAFALGQTGGTKAFQYLLNTPGEFTSAETLEAYGKTSKNAASVPAEINSWGLYRLGLRGLADSTIIDEAIIFLGSENEQTRLGAAHFFARGPANILIAEKTLQKAALEDRSANVRMAATSALRKLSTPSSLETIKKILANDPDYRVRISAVRVLQNFPVIDTKQNLFAALGDSNLQVGIAASEVIRSVSTKNELTEIISLARNAANWRIQGNLYEAALTVSNDKELAEEIFRLYEKTENPYGKAALLTALGRSTLAYGFINEQLHRASAPVIKSTAAASLVSINRHKEFTGEMQKRYVDIYKKAFDTGDAAVIGTIASALADSTLGYKKIITDYSFLQTAKNKLSLPKDNEALQPLEAAIAYFESRKLASEVKNEFNHPINWDLVKTIPSDQKVKITTAKGNIILRLLVEEAPGSAANFVQLVNAGYFDSKNFHRVVPNFVIQGGCNRGDGWGSEDYSIRSEFSMRRYAGGSVGMASAGKDTEGTQWFITHSPTPHLDGRYTIFAVVEEGMDTVHAMEVGDVIQKVELLK